MRRYTATGFYDHAHFIRTFNTATGFYDHAHFIRTFKSIVGITPSRYRKRHWNGA